jgi:hypothetical protein
MLKEEFIQMMKNDKELQKLKRTVLEVTNDRTATIFHIGANYTYEEWKEHLRKIVKEYNTISQ